MKPSEVISNLLLYYRENKIAHAYLVETNDIDNCILDLKKLIKQFFCVKEYKDNCNECNLCHLIDNDNLPSLITIKPDGYMIKKDSIEELKNRFSMKPVFTPFNVYIIESAEKMNSSSFNRLLKFIEEPEDNIIGFFVTDNKNDVVNTIVSRCESIKMMYDVFDKHVDSNIILDIAKEYINMISIHSDDLLWYNNDVILKKLPERNDIINFFKAILSILEDDVICNKNKINIVLKYLNELNYNVNISLLLDSFVIEMECLHEK